MATTPHSLGHEKLAVYQCAIEFVAVAANAISNMPSGYAFLADQLRRAAISIALNIAEGAGKTNGSADARRFYGIARGSAMECGAIFDSLKVLKAIDE
jgi:four helix bundle protein